MPIAPPTMYGWIIGSAWYAVTFAPIPLANEIPALTALRDSAEPSVGISTFLRFNAGIS
jgi:hypothetical protein